jgi:outer membrane lipoprotein-sorting protein
MMTTGIVLRHRRAGLVAIGGALLVAFACSAPAQTAVQAQGLAGAEIQKAVDAAYAKYKDLKARTPTTSRRLPRSIRISSGSRW